METPDAHQSTVEMIRAGGAWSASHLSHGFFGRNGGVSREPYASLNLARHVGDDPEAVAANWMRAWAAMPRFARIATVNQVHGIAVHAIGSDYDGARREGDGMVTGACGVALGIFTADCVPLLMVDVAAGVAGAFHAGWRGTLAGIARAAVAKMVAAGAAPERLAAAMGPAIGPCCYEVDVDLGERFASAWPVAAGRIRAGRPGKAMLDLRGILFDQLKGAGLAPGSITTVGPCTRCAADRFFSRRAAGRQCGLQLSFVGFHDGDTD